MKPRPTTKFTITVEIEVDGDANELRETVVGHLTGKTDAFFDDYGYGAWGGYDGPFLVACTVRDDRGEVIGHHEQREPETDEDDEEEDDAQTQA